MVSIIQEMRKGLSNLLGQRAQQAPTTLVGSAPATRLPEDEPPTMYTTTWCGDCRRAKRIFTDLGVPYREVNIEHDDTAAAIVLRVNGGMRSVPTIIFADGTVLVEPSSSALQAKLAPLVAAGRG
jgi:mycoredoxin